MSISFFFLKSVLLYPIKSYHTNSQGKYTYRVEDGTIYEGMWMHGRRTHGQLTFTQGDTTSSNRSSSNSNNDISNTASTTSITSYYRGDFVDEKMQGKGLFVWNNGSQYDGEWRNNMKHGYGVYLTEDGTIFKGKVICGVIISEDRE